MRKIKLTQGFFSIVDDEDYEWLIRGWKWHTEFARNGRKIYARAYDKKTKKNVKMHRIILNLTNPKIQVDHKNNNGLVK